MLWHNWWTRQVGIMSGFVIVVQGIEVGGRLLNKSLESSYLTVCWSLVCHGFSQAAHLTFDPLTQVKPETAAGCVFLAGNTAAGEEERHGRSCEVALPCFPTLQPTRSFAKPKTRGP